MRFSIITVCLNSVHTLEKTIQSVISQENVELEFIIVDGGSEDGTLDLIKKYGKKITKWISEPDQGLYDAMNKGVHMATGDVISFLNSNDWYEENIFPFIESVFSQSGCDMVAARQALIGDKGIVGYSVKERVEEDIYVDMIYSHPALFVKKRLFLEHGGFDLQYKICADYDWTLRMYIQGAKIKSVDFVTTNFTLGGLSSGRMCIEERKKISLRHLPLDRKAQRIDDINALYQKSMDTLYLDKVTKLIKTCKRERNELKMVLEKKLEWTCCCHLFGTGLRAHECADILNTFGMKVGKIFDNNVLKQGTEWLGKIIEKPAYFEDGYTWVITTTFYEKEVEKQVKAMGIRKYVLFSEIIRIISDFAVKKNISI